MNIVIPMAGEGSRFVKAGYAKPKPFIDVCGKPMIVRVMENLRYKNARFILLGRKSHLEREKKVVKAISRRFNAVFLPIDRLTEGTACTVLYARRYINNNAPLLIANSDQIVDVDISAFIGKCLKGGSDGEILTFIDPHKDKKWSFAKVNRAGLVTEVKEKDPISKYATVGIYLYRRGADFINAAIDMIAANDRVNNEFYTCPTYNYAIREKLKIGVFNIGFSQMHGIGTPEDLARYTAVLGGEKK
ncbi:MAG: lipopolysaccharide biosynthesis protein [Elusimicrobia bacterium GWB2_63_22]|nr:MAG: lipopolysaccharide biosynthesis protein [Elusimicrobia bacterium GWB2_63_22]